MLTFKCKMCGGNLIISTNSKISECEYCGSVQTIPSSDDEKKATLFNRANRLRMANEFDKAAVILRVSFPSFLRKQKDIGVWYYAHMV